MAFDPDAFLAKNPVGGGGGFDPDAFLAKKPASSGAGFDPDAYLSGKRQQATSGGYTPSDIPIYAGDFPEGTFPAGTSHDTRIAPPKASQYKEPGIGEKIRGAGEAIVGAVSGIPAQIIGGLQGVTNEIFSGKIGTAQGERDAEKYAADFVARHSYQPRTETGKQYLEKAGEIMAPLAFMGPEIVPRAEAIHAAKEPLSIAARKIGEFPAMGFKTAGKAIAKPVTGAVRTVAGTELKDVTQHVRQSVEKVADELSKKKANEAVQADEILQRLSKERKAARGRAEPAMDMPIQSYHQLGTDIKSKMAEHSSKIEESSTSEINRMQNDIAQSTARRYAAGDTLLSNSDFQSSLRKAADFAEKYVSPANSALRKAISDAVQKIKQAPNFNAADSEIKSLRALSNSKEGTGYGVQIKKLADSFQNSLRSYSPEYDSLIRKYPQLKGDVEALPTKTQEIPASELPGKIFKNASSYEQFVSDIGGDMEYAQQIAHKYFGNEIRGMSANQARAFAEKNSDVLNSVGGDTKSLVQNYVNASENLEASEKAYSEAENEISKSIAHLGKQSAELQRDVEKLQRYEDVESVKSNVKGAIDKYAREGYISKEKADELAAKYEHLIDTEEKVKRARKALTYATMGTAAYIGGAGYWIWKTMTSLAGGVR